MTSIQIEQIEGSSKNKYSIAMVGHAGYAEEGKDIVCSAISILYHTLVCELKKKKCSCKWDVTDGIVLGEICWDKEEKDVSVVLETIESGLVLLSETCGEYVRFEKIETTGN